MPTVRDRANELARRRFEASEEFYRSRIRPIIGGLPSFTKKYLPLYESGLLSPEMLRNIPYERYNLTFRLPPNVSPGILSQIMSRSLPYEVAIQRLASEEGGPTIRIWRGIRSRVTSPDIVGPGEKLLAEYHTHPRVPFAIASQRDYEHTTTRGLRDFTAARRDILYFSPGYRRYFILNPLEKQRSQLYNRLTSGWDRIFTTLERPSGYISRSQQFLRRLLGVFFRRSPIDPYGVLAYGHRQYEDDPGINYMAPAYMSLARFGVSQGYGTGRAIRWLESSAGEEALETATRPMIDKLAASGRIFASEEKLVVEAKGRAAIGLIAPKLKEHSFGRVGNILGLGAGAAVGYYAGGGGWASILGIGGWAGASLLSNVLGRRLGESILRRAPGLIERLGFFRMAPLETAQMLGAGGAAAVLGPLGYFGGRAIGSRLDDQQQYNSLYGKRTSVRKPTMEDKSYNEMYNRPSIPMGTIKMNIRDENIDPEVMDQIASRYLKNNYAYL